MKKISQRMAREKKMAQVRSVSQFMEPGFSYIPVRGFVAPLWHMKHCVRAVLGMNLGNSLNSEFINGTFCIGALSRAFQSFEWQ